MSKVFYRKKFSDYLGEQRAIDDIITFYIPDGGVTPTPTPVPVSPTPTPSITPTNTLTPTPTPSVTATLTPTPTNTGTPTPTPTKTPAPACDITYTELPSPTPSPTPTITPTNTSSPTPTITPTNTSSPTPTPTASPGPLIDPDAQAFFNAITASGGTLTSPQQTAINNLVIDLKGYGLWTKMIGLYPVVGTTSVTQSFNLKNPSQYNLTFAGTWAHTLTGANPGSNGYASTNIIPSIINFATAGSIHYSMYITENNAAGRYDFGSFQPGLGDFAAISSFAGNNTAYIGVGTSGFLTTGNGGSTKKNWLWTNDGTTSYIYRDGVSIVSGAKTISTGPAVDIVISANNNNGGKFDFGERDWALASIGYGMNAIEAGDYNTAVLAYQTALGRQN